MRENNIVVAIPAGLAATGVMSVVLLLAPLAGIPEVNMPRLLGAWLGLSLSGGMILFFFIGVGLAILFSILPAGWLAAPVWLQGLFFGIGTWLFLMVMGGPLIGWGLFAANTSSPLGTLVTTFLGHIAYGATLGFTYEKAALRMWSA